MDRNYYYRVLGLQEGASPKQITEAYESRMAKLASADYEDDPEYVVKKMTQAKYAYSVLMGSAAPLTKAQRQRNYECYKDDIEDNRDSEHFMEKHGRIMKKLDTSVISANVRSKVSSAFKGVELPKEMGKIIVIVVGFSIALIAAAVGSIVDIVSEPHFESAEPVYSVEYVDKDYTQDNIEAVKRIMNRDMEYDFFGSLDFVEDLNYDDVEWEISDETYDQLWSLNIDLAYALGIDSIQEMMAYITGDEDAYWNNGEHMISLYMVELMGAPAFSDVAGMQNIYSGEIIYTYADYMEFLIMTAEIQTDEICGIPPVDYYD